MEAKFVKQITVTDPDTKGKVKMDVYKHQTGGMFAIDSSYVEQVLDDDTNSICIPDPFSEVGDERELYLI